MPHPLAARMESWWAEHGGVHDDAQWIAFLDNFAHILSRKLSEQSREHSNGGRFGMSKAGGCTRAAILKLRNADEEPRSGSDRVTFWNGHMAEVLGIATLQAIGIPVSPAMVDGAQHIVSIDPFMQSSTDAIIRPCDDLPHGAVLSVKSGGYKMSGKTWKKGEGASWKRYGFAQYPLDGVRKTQPGYWAQAQAEMHGSGIPVSLFVLVAKDMIKAMKDDPYMKQNGSMSFFVEAIEYDAAWCESTLTPTWRDAWGAYLNGEIGSALVLSREGSYVEMNPADGDGNKARSGMFNFCDYCDLRNACESSLLTSQLAASIEQAQEAV